MTASPPAATDEATRNRAWLGLVVGVLWIAGLTGLKLVFSHAIGDRTPFLLYFSGVLVAGWLGGVYTGLVITAVSAAVAHVVFLDASFGIDANLLATSTYLLEGTVLSYLAARVADDRRRLDEVTRESKLGRERLETVLGAVEDGIVVQDAEGNLVYANAAAAENTGFGTPEAMMSLQTSTRVASYEMFTPTGEPFPLGNLPGRVLLKGGQATPELIRFRNRTSGKEGWSLYRATAIRGEHGDVRSVVSIIQDVTAEHEREQALQVSREWFSTALRSIGDAVIATDPAGVITFMNPAAEALTGWPMAEARDRPLAEVFRIIQEHDRQPAISPVDKVIAFGNITGLENHTILIRRDGSERPIDDSAAPIRRNDSVLEGVVLVFRDVERQRREQLRAEFLARATAELNMSLDYATTLANVVRIAVPQMADWCAVDVVENGEPKRLAVSHVDPAKIEFVREIEERWPPDPDAQSGVPEILRTGRAELVPQIPSEMLEAAARDDEHLRLIRALSLRSYIGVPLGRGGVTFGALTLVMAESNRLYDEDDLGFALALADRVSISVENARLFATAEQARRDAEAANRAKDEFLAMLGHELRNPLAPILSTLDLLRAPSTIPVDRALAVIDRQVKHLVRLVDDLLDVSRITRGRVEIDRVPLEVADIVGKALEQTRPLVEQRGHTVHTHVPEGLRVLGDSIRLAQVFTNLVTNAAKYTEPGGVLTIEALRDGEWAEIRVRDDGIGIAPEMLAHVFDMFVQAPQSIDRAQGGLGLGLTIVQNLVQLHGGTIDAKSDGPGKGSEIVVRLPATDARPRANTPPATPAEPEAISLDVLVVDDNEDAVDLLAEILRLLGHRPHTATHPREALELAERLKPPVALLDIGLPEIDGYELARRMRALDGLQSSYLVALTGYGQESDRAKSAASGFDAHLVKPAGMQQIRGALHDAMQRATQG